MKDHRTSVEELGVSSRRGGLTRRRESRRRSGRRLLWLLAVSGVCLSGTGRGQGQGELEETVVVTAQASPVTFHDLSRSVTVLDREEIRLLPVQSVADLLRYVVGLDVRGRSPYGVQTDFSARGAGFGQVLVLIDGVRINDSQSGHHNGDWAVALSDVERVEVLHGLGSSVHGADAFGATINVVTREGGSSQAQARVSAGERGLVAAEGRTTFGAGGLRQSVSLFGNRSSGFRVDRDFRTVGIGTRTDFASGRSLRFHHLNKAFGASGFYGPAPSREWTDATELFFGGPLVSSVAKPTRAGVFYRTHGDHFLWDRRRPGFFENRHRTHALGASLQSERTLLEGSRLSWGGEIGQDWIVSNNLGDHSYRRWAAYVEWQQQFGERVSVAPGIRFDHYSHFGSALSPSISANCWLHPRVKLRASAGKAFRIPTFTELYYSDPNHQASAGLLPEEAREVEAGLDWMPAPEVLVQASVFSRWDENLIDWVRESARQKWRTANLRALQSRGFEVGVQKALHDQRAILRLQYARVNSQAEALELISKYAQDYARHSFSAFGTLRLPGGMRLGQDAHFKVHSGGRRYWVLDQKWLRAFGPFTAFLEVSNLLDTEYEEIRGVVMPGRWIRGGLEWEPATPSSGRR